MLINQIHMKSWHLSGNWSKKLWNYHTLEVQILKSKIDWSCEAVLRSARSIKFPLFACSYKQKLNCKTKTSTATDPRYQRPSTSRSTTKYNISKAFVLLFDFNRSAYPDMPDKFTAVRFQLRTVWNLHTILKMCTNRQT